MTLEEYLGRYRILLKEKYDRIHKALLAFEEQFQEVVRDAGLPMPSPVNRAGPGTVRDIVTVSWTQEVARPGTMVTVRIDWTVSTSAFHFSIRDPRDSTQPYFKEVAIPEMKVPVWFVEKAHELASDKGLPTDRWEARIYTV